MPEETNVPISSFPDAESITNADKVTGLQGNANKNFTFSSILAWFVNAVKSAFVPVSRTINGKTLETNIALTTSDIGAQPTITASGILKGDGAGGVSAATPGTDYQTPLTAGTDYATPGMIPSVPIPSDSTPQNLGTAAAGSSANYSRADHIHQKPTYSKADVGLGNVENERQYSSNNPPPYPVTYISVTFNCDSSGRHTFSNGELPNRALSSPVGCLAKDASNNYINAGAFDINPRYTTAGTFISSSCANKEVTLFFAVYN